MHAGKIARIACMPRMGQRVSALKLNVGSHVRTRSSSVLACAPGAKSPRALHGSNENFTFTSPCSCHGYHSVGGEEERKRGGVHGLKGTGYKEIVRQIGEGRRNWEVK
eukprot:470913-Hanusia_phi.AAC.1